MVETTDIGKLVLCPQGIGKLTFMAFGDATITLLKGEGFGEEWIGKQSEIQKTGISLAVRRKVELACSEKEWKHWVNMLNQCNRYSID